LVITDFVASRLTQKCLAGSGAVVLLSPARLFEITHWGHWQPSDCQLHRERLALAKSAPSKRD
jgi:hypothetical protein